MHDDLNYDKFIFTYLKKNFALKFVSIIKQLSLSLFDFLKYLIKMIEMVLSGNGRLLHKISFLSKENRFPLGLKKQ